MSCLKITRAVRPLASHVDGAWDAEAAVSRLERRRPAGEEGKSQLPAGHPQKSRPLGPQPCASVTRRGTDYPKRTIAIRAFPAWSRTGTRASAGSTAMQDTA